jgi:hypothetical protein
MIDRRVQQRQSMLVTNIGKHNIILGKLWFKEHRVLPDYRNDRLLWLEQVTLREYVLEQLVRPLPRKILKRPLLNLTY